MAYSFNFNFGSDQLNRCAKEAAVQIGLEIAETGITVCAQKSTSLSVKGDEKGIVITYSRKCEIFRGIS